MITISRSRQARHLEAAEHLQDNTARGCLSLPGDRIVGLGAAVLYGAITLCFFMIFFYFALGLDDEIMCLGASALMGAFAIRFAAEAMRGCIAGVVVPWRRAGAPVFKTDRPIAFALSLINQVLGLLACTAFAAGLALAGLS